MASTNEAIRAKKEREQGFEKFKKPLLCNFCDAPNPRWRYADWAACNACAAAIDPGDHDRLYIRKAAAMLAKWDSKAPENWIDELKWAREDLEEDFWSDPNIPYGL